ncbi:MAG: hypothetical protein QM756_19170 [Polyangiaceae bacterium]
MRLIVWLAERLGFKAPTTTASPETHFVYVKIPEDLGPLDRGARYEDPLQDSLDSRGLGDITGGGSQLGDERPDGTRPIEFCGLDLELIDLEQGRALLRARLVELGAPEGTELHYTVGDTKLQDELRRDGWLLDRPRTFLHPGFGI